VCLPCPAVDETVTNRRARDHGAPKSAKAQRQDEQPQIAHLSLVRKPVARVAHPGFSACVIPRRRGVWCTLLRGGCQTANAQSDQEIAVCAPRAHHGYDQELVVCQGSCERVRLAWRLRVVIPHLTIAKRLGGGPPEVEASAGSIAKAHVSPTGPSTFTSRRDKETGRRCSGSRYWAQRDRRLSVFSMIPLLVWF